MNMKVACINRNNLKDIYQQNKLIFKTSFDAIIDDFSKIEFLEKTKVETNDNFKQIIPYTIILNQNNQIAFYRRKGNEKRLHGLWSAGFGGHIEDFEFENKTNIKELFLKSATRELNEEYSNKIEYNLDFRGIINEEKTEVGKTHIGLVFTAKVDKALFSSSEEIEKLKWIDLEAVSDYKKELWSEMAIELLF